MKDDITVSEAPLDIPSPPQRQPVTPYKLRRAAGEAELRPVSRLLAEYMVVGTNHPRAKRLDLPIGEPLSLEQAAAVLDIKRRNARQIFRLTQFRKLFASMIADLRSGAHARMVRNMICIANNPGDGPPPIAACSYGPPRRSGRGRQGFQRQRATAQ